MRFFKFPYLFTANLNFGHEHIEPIDIPGGKRYIEKITNGTIHGPAVNGTIFPGIGAQAVYKNGTLWLPSIVVADTTNDGETFFVQENGIGSRNDQYTQLTVTVSGKYKFLQENLIIAHLHPFYTEARSVIDVFCVQCIGFPEVEKK